MGNQIILDFLKDEERESRFARAFNLAIKNDPNGESYKAHYQVWEREIQRLGVDYSELGNPESRQALEQVRCIADKEAPLPEADEELASKVYMTYVLISLARCLADEESKRHPNVQDFEKFLEIKEGYFGYYEAYTQREDGARALSKAEEILRWMHNDGQLLGLYQGQVDPYEFIKELNVNKLYDNFKESGAMDLKQSAPDTPRNFHHP